VGASNHDLFQNKINLEEIICRVDSMEVNGINSGSCPVMVFGFRNV
jgi:hypothetical protein